MRMAVSFIIVIAFVGLIIYSVSTGKQESKIDKINNEELPIVDNFMEQNTNTNTNNEGVAKNGDTLVMNYTGRLTDGTEFDSNVNPKFGHVEPFEFKLGAGQVIKGWDEGLLGMSIGEKKTLTIPAEKAYGSQAVGSIPANSTLIFDVELVNIK